MTRLFLHFGLSFNPHFFHFIFNDDDDDVHRWNKIVSKNKNKWRKIKKSSHSHTSNCILKLPVFENFSLSFLVKNINTVVVAAASRFYHEEFLMRNPVCDTRKNKKKYDFIELFLMLLCHH